MTDTTRVTKDPSKLWGRVAAVLIVLFILLGLLLVWRALREPVEP